MDEDAITSVSALLRAIRETTPLPDRQDEALRDRTRALDLRLAVLELHLPALLAPTQRAQRTRKWSRRKRTDGAVPSSRLHEAPIPPDAALTRLRETLEPAHRALG